VPVWHSEVTLAARSIPETSATMASTEVIQLPVLDLNNANVETGKELVEAVKNYGFVFIKNNHNEIPVRDIEDMFQLVQASFHIPTQIFANLL
jgi:isopenicillin N synthase-like dioxygenase